MPNTLPTLTEILSSLYWGLAPSSWIQDQGVLSISAGSKTDLFIDPHGTEPILNAPRLLFETSGNWRLRVRVRVEFGAPFDAGVLLIWGGEHTWAKLCFEYSPQLEPMIVSVVTNGISDDANAFTVAGDTVSLEISRFGQAYAFHAAVEGGPWQLIRHFALPNTDTVSAGLVSQSPLGVGCTAHFSDILYAVERRKALRRNFVL